MGNAELKSQPTLTAAELLETARRATGDVISAEATSPDGAAWTTCLVRVYPPHELERGFVPHLQLVVIRDDDATTPRVCGYIDERRAALVTHLEAADPSLQVVCSVHPSRRYFGGSWYTDSVRCLVEDDGQLVISVGPPTLQLARTVGDERANLPRRPETVGELSKALRRYRSTTPFYARVTTKEGTVLSDAVSLEVDEAENVVIVVQSPTERVSAAVGKA